jgi:aminoglycoside phosphotransferase (APT) family kinase protein
LKQNAPVSGGKEGALPPARAERDPDHERYRALLARDFPDLTAASFRFLGAGTDHIAFEIGGATIIRFARVGDGSALAREARLLRHVADHSPLPIPRPTHLHREHGYIGYQKLPGTPLLDAVGGFDLRQWPGFAATLGRFLSEINTLPFAPIRADLDEDSEPLDGWRAEARETFARVRPQIPARYAGSIAAFLATPPPPAPVALVLAHNDLGIEHILVDHTTRQITGIIDWGDAALADPARDLGKFYRDLGAATLDAVLRHYTASDDTAALRARAIFYGRCGMLEDLEYGLETGSVAYVAKSLAALPWLFPEGVKP